MKNPGLSAFAAPYVHPRLEDIREGDPDFDREDEEEDSDWVPFSGWRREHGQALRVPTQQGPVFKPGTEPADVIHGEVISPREQDAADGIINGDHDSTAPAANPDVERARQDLHTPGAADTVSTLSGLLSGRRPEDVGGLDEAHDWLGQHFTGVRVNPSNGTLLAQSPAGTQIVKRQQHLPAIPQPVAPPPTYKLTNKHGEFESDDPQRIIRSMIAFQIVHNAIAAEQKKKDDDQNNGLGATSGFMGDLAGGLGRLVDSFRGPARPRPRTDVPHGAVWEGNTGGLDVNHAGQRGGWVARSVDAPADWLHAGGTAYSPGHPMRLMLSDEEKYKPRPDPRFPGHTFTYAPSPAASPDEIGYTEPRRFGSVNYWVQPDIHPAARGAGFDLIPTPKPTPPPAGTMPARRRPVPPMPPHTRRPGSGGAIGGPPLPPTTSAVEVNDLCPVCASGYLEPFDDVHHECLNCGSLVTAQHVGFSRHAGIDDSRQDWSKDAPPLHQQGPAPVGYATQNQHDLLGSLGWYADRLRNEYVNERGGRYHALVPEPDGTWTHYVTDDDSEFRHDHPDLGTAYNAVTDINNGAEPEGLGYRLAAAKPKGGLGRGLQRIDEEVQSVPSNPLGIGNVPAKADGAVDLDQTQTHHPLFNAPALSPEQEDEVYEAPTELREKGQVRRQAATDDIEEFLGKQGFFPVHKPGQSRAYAHPIPGVNGAYFRLTEGVPNAAGQPSGWALTADMTGRAPGQTFKVMAPGGMKNRSMPEVTDRAMPPMSFLAGGSHPVDDDELNRAIRDVHENGRASDTYRRLFEGNAYEPPSPEPRGSTQRAKRLLSSVVENPGLTRFVS